MIRGFEGVLIEMLTGLSFIVLIASILTAVLVLWKIGFHLQPAENRKKALEAPRERGKGLRDMLPSTNFMRDLREMKNFAVIVKKSQEDAFEGEERILTMEIDGNPRAQAVRNLNDMIEPIFDMEEYAKISLGQDASGGRNICFKILGEIDGDEYLEIGEYIGPDWYVRVRLTWIRIQMRRLNSSSRHWKTPMRKESPGGSEAKMVLVPGFEPGSPG